MEIWALRSTEHGRLSKQRAECCISTELHMCSSYKVWCDLKLEAKKNHGKGLEPGDRDKGFP